MTVESAANEWVPTGVLNDLNTAPILLNTLGLALATFLFAIPRCTTGTSPGAAAGVINRVAFLSLSRW